MAPTARVVEPLMVLFRIRQSSDPAAYQALHKLLLTDHRVETYELLANDLLVRACFDDMPEMGNFEECLGRTRGLERYETMFVRQTFRNYAARGEARDRDI